MKMHEMLDWVAREAACRALLVCADRIGPVTAPAERLAGLDTWIGPAADDARTALGAAARTAGEAAVELRRAAAAELEAIAAERAEAEARARAEALGLAGLPAP